jgi:glycogen(starch) synthase
MKALKMVYPDYEEVDYDSAGGRMSYPRPLSEPPSPSSSRATTPAPSEQGSSDEVDSEGEVK